MECNRIEVHYTNNGKPGLYEVSDLAVCADDDTMVCCSWLLTDNATKEVGSLHFTLRFACITEDGTVDYAWNTAKFKGISISEGLYNSEVIAEKYADILEQWKNNLSQGGIFQIYLSHMQIIGGEDEIATETTFDEIKYAYEDERKLLVAELGVVKLFGVYNGINFIFSGVWRNKSYVLTCTEENKWTEEIFELSAGESVNESTVKEAIEKATPDIVNAVIEALPNGDEVYY